MTWDDVKIFTLQKMFETQGDTLEINDATRPYIMSMPLVANEGLQRLATVGRFLLRPLVIVQGTVMAGDPPDVIRPLGQGWQRYDLRELAPEFYQLEEDEIFLEQGSRYARTGDFRLEAEHVLMLPADKAGLWRVYYRAYPGEITRETPGSYELPLHPEMSVILPLYMASQLYKDDDVGMATTWRNEFEIALTALIEASRVKRYGRETIKNTTGWW